MKIINLKDYYTYYTDDMFIEIPDELANVFKDFDKAEAAYERKKYRYKAHYSLDRGDGIEHNILFVSLSLDEIYERKLTSQQLHAAIAKAEGVSEKAVRIGIERGLHTIEKYLKSFF